MTNLVTVDDESLVTDFLAFLLESEGYCVYPATNGKEAREVIARVRPALVITDLMMPVQSGLELATVLRASVEFKHLPIILCSAVPGAIAQADRHLFSAMLQKPYPPAELVQLVASYVRHAGPAEAEDGSM
ncbi:Response regulator (plasmid) [Pararobbsia alpina]|uniref:response regulator n=1 Tax=Pararobbsia alpina TaxID=621374 RepID=UPI0039A5EDE9